MWMSFLSGAWDGIWKILSGVFSFLKDKKAEDKAAERVVEEMREKLAKNLQERIHAMDVEFASMIARKDSEYSTAIKRKEAEHEEALRRRDEDITRAFKRINALEKSEERCRESLREAKATIATQEARIAVLEIHLEEAKRVREMRESIEFQYRTHAQTRKLIDASEKAETELETRREDTIG